jgi:hypothetical protein
MTEAEEMEELAHRRRKERFIREGLDVEMAHELAGRLMQRDRDLPYGDDRRVCFECIYLSGKNCTNDKLPYKQRNPPLRFVLQRCDYFDMRGKK